MPNPSFIKAMTRREIANLLGIGEHTLKRKLKEKGISLPKGLVTPQAQKNIFDALWYPPIYAREDFDAYG